MSKCRFMAMCAGALGALASVVGKLGMDESYSKLASEKVFHYTRATIDSTSYRIWLLTWIFSIGLLALTFLLNCVMWSVFVESMQGLNSGEAVVLNTGANILVSACLGKLVFGETFGVIWWTGASFILVGIVLLKSQSAVSDHHAKDG